MPRSSRMGDIRLLSGGENMEPGSPDPRPGARGVEKELKPEVGKPISPCGLKEGEVWASAPFSNVRAWALDERPKARCAKGAKPGDRGLKLPPKGAARTGVGTTNDGDEAAVDNEVADDGDEAADDDDDDDEDEDEDEGPAKPRAAAPLTGADNNEAAVEPVLLVSEKVGAGARGTAGGGTPPYFREVGT